MSQPHAETAIPAAGPSHPGTARSGWLLVVTWVAMVAGYVGLVAFGARGPRGSDQFWYVTDLIMHDAGKGLVTNYLSPTVWLDANFGLDALPPPVHNVPVVRIAATVNSVVSDPYLAWVVTNTLLGLAIAGLTYAVARRVLSRWASTVTAGVVLFSAAFTVWHALNPLMEQSVVLFALLVVLGCTEFPSRPWFGVSLMTVGGVLLVASRINYAVVVVLVAVLLVHLIRKGAGRWIHLSVYAGASILGIVLLSRLLTAYPAFGFTKILMMWTPADTANLGASLSLVDATVDLRADWVLQKALKQTVNAVVPQGGSEVLGETLTLVIFVFGFVAAPRSRDFAILRYLGGSFLGVYLLTAMLFQPQARYLAPLLPVAALLAVAATIRLVRPRAPRSLPALGTLALLAAIASSIAVTASFTKSAASEQARLDEYRQLAAVPSEGSLLSLYSQQHGGYPGSELALAYVVAPRPLIVGSVRADACVSDEFVTKWDITTVVTAPGWTQDEVEDAFCTPPSTVSVVGASEEGRFKLWTFD